MWKQGDYLNCGVLSGKQLIESYYTLVDVILPLFLNPNITATVITPINPNPTPNNPIQIGLLQ